MNSHFDRPRQTRTLYATLELCKNAAHGENGALELIVSGMHMEAPRFLYWPLDAAGSLKVSQLQDLAAALGEIANETVWTRLTVQAELFESP